MKQSREQLLRAYAALPETYQPAWGLDETRTQARRASEDRLAVLLASLATFPGEKPLRILDIGCAQGYFTLSLARALSDRGRGVQIIGVDYLDANVRFCGQLSDYHGLGAHFIHDRFDGGFFERHESGKFDVVLALNVLHHVHELQGVEAVRAALDAIRANSRVLFCEVAQPAEALEWIGEWHEADDALLSDYAFRRKLGEFETHLTDVRRPLYACSNELACVGGLWFAFDQTLERAHPGVPDHFAGQRHCFLGAHTIVKGYCGEGDFGAFNRAELAAEAETLRALQGEPLRYPPLLAQADDGDMMWLARGLLPGRLLSELIEERSAFDRELVLRALLEELAYLERRGFHHGDLRSWNMLWHEDALRLIDFGSMTQDASPLHRVALAAVIAELARGELANVEPWYCSPRPVTDYPPRWRKLVRYLLGCPQPEFSYRLAAELLDAEAAGPFLTSDQELAICPEVLEVSARKQVESFCRAKKYAIDLGRHLRDASRYAGTLESERARAAKALRDASTHAESLEVRLRRQEAESQAERTAAQAALADAARYAESIEEERRELKKGIREMEEKFIRMRRRFRLLKPLWPREDGKPE